MASLPACPEPPPAWIDKRAEPRQRTLFAIGRLLVDGHQRVCTLRNVAPNGTGVELDAPPPVGAVVSIEMRGLLAREAEVRWVDGARAGLALVAARPEPEHPDRVLRSPRFALDTPVTLLAEGGPAAGRAIDIALGGLKLVAAPAAAPGEVVTTVLPDGRALRGRVCWRSGHRMGLRFAAPLSPRELAAILHATGAD